MRSRYPPGSASSKTATCSTSSLTSGTHNIVATYTGNAGNNGSTSSALTQTVNKATSTAAVASSANPSVVGANVALTATVTGASPTGSVNFKDGASSISGCSAVALPTGSANSKTATCSSASLAAGKHNIVATYGGDAGNHGSTSSALTEMVNTVNTASVGLASSANPASTGTSVIFTATVTGSAPTGSVRFTADGTTLTGCGAVALPAGSASSKTVTCSTASLSASTRRSPSHSIVATYGGNSANAGSTSATLAQVVNTASSGTSLASSANPSLVGANVTFTATVTGTAPTGNVGFTADGTTLDRLRCGGVARRFAPTPRPQRAAARASRPAAHNIVATYGGNAGNNGSTSSTLTEMVNTVNTARVDLASSANPSSTAPA